MFPPIPTRFLSNLLLIINEVIKLDWSVRACIKSLVPHTRFCFIEPQISLGQNGKLNFRRQWIFKPTKSNVIMFKKLFYLGIFLLHQTKSKMCQVDRILKLTSDLECLQNSDQYSTDHLGKHPYKTGSFLIFKDTSTVYNLTWRFLCLPFISCPKKVTILYIFDLN